jgi:hypothetical protein
VQGVRIKAACLAKRIDFSLMYPEHFGIPTVNKILLTRHHLAIAFPEVLPNNSVG